MMMMIIIIYTYDYYKDSWVNINKYLGGAFFV